MGGSKIFFKSYILKISFSRSNKEDFFDFLTMLKHSDTYGPVAQSGNARDS